MNQDLINRSNVGSPGNRWNFSPSGMSLQCSYCNKLGNMRTCYLKRKIGTHGVHVLARSRFLRTCSTVN